MSKRIQLFKDPSNGKLYRIKGDEIRQYPAGAKIRRNGTSSQGFSSMNINDPAERQSWVEMVGLVSVSV